MKKVTVKAYNRVKKGKSTTVRQHTKKYESPAEKSLIKTKRKKGSGSEMKSKKSKKCC